MRSIPTRFAFAVIIGIPLAYFLISAAHWSWVNYWLLKDGQPGAAIVTKELWSGHDAVGYKYSVNQKEYTGRSIRNWQEPKYSNVKIGDESIVYFSASHPWLSLLYKPRTVVEGWPVLIIAAILEIFIIVTVVNPKSKWALDLSEKKKIDSAKTPLNSSATKN
jgi:hypothetical protein